MKQIWSNETDEKRARLLQSALEEFAEKGYDLASTNLIVQGAGVSKGLLFHHFQNKKALFFYIGEQCMEYFFAYLNSYSDPISSDPLERLRDIHLLKMELFIREPLIYQLAISFFMERSEQLSAELQDFEKRFNERYFSFYLERLNTAQLRQDTSYTKSLFMIFESFEALTRKYVESFKHLEDKGVNTLDKLTADLNHFIQILKFGLYK